MSSPGFHARSIGLSYVRLRHAGVGRSPASSCPTSSPGVWPKPNRARPLLQPRPVVGAARVVAVADVVEVRVARLGERLAQDHRAVRDGVPVVELELVEAVALVRRARDVLAGREQVVLHGREGDDRLEGRAGRIETGRRAVQAGDVRRSATTGSSRARSFCRVRLADEDGRLVRRARGHRANRPVPRVERDDRPAARIERLVLLRDLDALADRPLGGPLQLDVERQPDRVAGLRLLAVLRRAERSAERVDADLRGAGAASEVAVESGLDAGLADLVARPISDDVGALRLQLLRRDLAHVAEQVRRRGAVLVVAEERLRDAHARELGLALGEVGHLLLADRGLDRDRRERVFARGLDLPHEPAARHVEDACQLAEHPVAALLRQVADPDLHGGAGTFATIVRPSRSRITPRGASMRTVRTWLSSAVRRYRSPESTCSDQRRKKSSPNMPSAIAPSTPTRSASCGVRR